LKLGVHGERNEAKRKKRAHSKHKSPKTNAVVAISFGKYRLLERVGAGGVAELYRATFVEEGQRVFECAIKRILPQYSANANIRAQFRNECQISTGLAHPNIVHAFDFGEVQGELFLAMELVESVTLSQILRHLTETERLLPLECSLYIVDRLLAALAHCHSSEGRPGVVHLDVSPSNLLVRFDGALKLSDFGSAQLLNASNSSQGAALKVGYASPEQISKKAIDVRADIFSVGVVLYQLLTGRMPFQSDAEAFASAVSAAAYTPMSELNDAVTDSLERLVASCLRAEKGHRPASAEAARVELGQCGLRMGNEAQLSQILSHLFPEQQRAYRPEASVLPRHLTSSQKSLVAGAAARHARSARNRTGLRLAVGGVLVLTLAVLLVFVLARFF
jgi:serine/threonine protein kinase